MYDKLHKEQEITPIKICVQAALSLLRAIKVMYNIQLLLPTENHGYLFRSSEKSKYQVILTVTANLIILQGLVIFLLKHTHWFITATDEANKAGIWSQQHLQKLYSQPSLMALLCEICFAPEKTNLPFALCLAFRPLLVSEPGTCHPSFSHPLPSPCVCCHLQITRNCAFLLENFQSCSWLENLIFGWTQRNEMVRNIHSPTLPFQGCKWQGKYRLKYSHMLFSDFIQSQSVATQVAKSILIYTGSCSSLETVLLQTYFGSDLLRANRELQINHSPSISWRRRWHTVSGAGLLPAEGCVLWHPTSFPSPRPRLPSVHLSLPLWCQVSSSASMNISLEIACTTRSARPGNSCIQRYKRLSWRIQLMIYLSMSLTQLPLH